MLSASNETNLDLQKAASVGGQQPSFSMAELSSMEGQLSSRESATPSSPCSARADTGDELASQSTHRAASPRSALTSAGGLRKGPLQPPPSATADCPPPPPKALSPVWQHKKLPALLGKEQLHSGEAILGGQKPEVVCRSLPDLKVHLRALADQDELGWAHDAGSPSLAGLPQYRAILDAESPTVGTPTGRGAARVKAAEHVGQEGQLGRDGGKGNAETPRGLEGATWAGSPHSPARALREKASSVTLWHEEQSATRRGQLHAVQFQSSPRSPRAKPGSIDRPDVYGDDTTRVFPPIAQPLRVDPPPEWRIPERKRSTESGKSGGPQLSDFSLLADTTHRLNNPGRTREEARALLSMAVLTENAQESARAVDVYERFLRACLQLDDPELQALAHNCLGIAHAAAGDGAASKLGSPKLAAFTEDLRENTGSLLSGESVAEYEAALEHHALHAELAADERGRFIACANSGHLLARMDKGEEAVEMYKRALAHAIASGDAANERVAVGSLGRLLLQRDSLLGSAHDCIRRYLDVCTALEDGSGVAEAHFLLGVVATRCSKYATAAGEFEAALQAAKASGNKDIAKFARIHIGMAKGKVSLAQQLVALDTADGTNND